jgi:hypothetical protein
MYVLYHSNQKVAVEKQKGRPDKSGRPRGIKIST